ncbi:hypothetical protein [Pseudomonas poae]|uniref:hypothetical protein n=1 Tax=Pseudomonas poae TaxID=200451 RepID=UPI0011B09DBD|nr:hypothetical protein [Pseudomonas poae]
MFIQTPLSPSPRGVLIEQITAQFSTPPKLREVVRDHIQHLLDQRYPTLNFSAERVAIGTPMQAGGYEYRSLPDAVLERLAGALRQWSPCGGAA